MDAHTGALDCATVVGYAFDGKICAPVLCSCEGSECDSLYETADECDSAYQACYAKRGVRRSCTTHADCRQQYRSCCPECYFSDANLLIATSYDSPEPKAAGMCVGDPEQVCGKCLPQGSPTLYSICLEGQCRMVDVSAQADCETSADCKLVSKSCCECPQDVRTDLVSVNVDTTTLPFCSASDDCVLCEEESGRQVGSTCNTDVGKCGMFVTTL